MTIIHSPKNFSHHSTDYVTYCQNPQVHGKSITWRDFIPLNSWKVDLEGDRIERTGENPIYCHITDGHRSYYNNRPSRIAMLCNTLIVDPARLLARLIVKTLAIVTLFPLWQQQQPRSLIGRVNDYLWNFVDIPVQIVFFAAKELSSVYGIVTPFNGRKLYASFERLAWNLGVGIGMPSGRGLLELNLQPDLPFDHHLFRGHNTPCKDICTDNVCIISRTLISGIAPFTQQSFKSLYELCALQT